MAELVTLGTRHADGARPAESRQHVTVLHSIEEADEDARECRRITREHAKTFSLAARLLPVEKQRATYALYAFCRVADDLIDQSVDLDAAERSARLDRYRGQLHDALAGRPDGAVFRELARVVSTFAIPHAPLFELLTGVGRDLSVSRYATWIELERYCQGVASSVGEMCTYVFAGSARPARRVQAIGYARTLGVAMQLTNILRDVGEDARRGRCYLPSDDLARFGLHPDDVLTQSALGRDPRWTQLMRFEIDRARELYRIATPGIALLDHDAQRCAAACALGYAGILSAIEAQHYDTIASRARLSARARISVFYHACRFPGRVADRRRPPHGVRGAPDGSVADRLA